jgi:peroxiredoxin
MSNVTQEQLDAHLITTDRRAVRIGDLLDRPLVLAFFPAAFTGTCTAELCAFRDNLARFNAINAQVYGVSVDLPPSLQVFAERQNLNFPLLSDANREAIRAFDVVWPSLLGGVHDVARRSVFVLAPGGAMIYQWLSEQPSDEPPYEEVVAAAERAR